jgi:hypothetical protein
MEMRALAAGKPLPREAPTSAFVVGSSLDPNVYLPDPLPKSWRRRNDPREGEDRLPTDAEVERVLRRLRNFESPGLIDATNPENWIAPDDMRLYVGNSALEEERGRAPRRASLIAREPRGTGAG